VTLTDGFLIAATVAGPILAVQAQKWVERSRERRESKRRIFHTLMATRGTRLAPEHVQALNMIDLEFGGSKSTKQTSKEKDVLIKWRIYADQLNVALPDTPTPSQQEAWLQRADDLFIDLLEALAVALGYTFDKVQLRRGVYRPRGHTDAEFRQDTIQRAFADIVTGRAALPMNVISFPISDEAVELQKRVHEAFLSAASGGAITVRRAPEQGSKG
jgi:hypothetical protein